MLLVVCFFTLFRTKNLQPGPKQGVSIDIRKTLNFLSKRGKAAWEYRSDCMEHHSSGERRQNKKINNFFLLIKRIYIYLGYSWESLEFFSPNLREKELRVKEESYEPT